MYDTNAYRSQTFLRSYNPNQYKCKKIPTALKEQLWIQKCGKVFECSCQISWCEIGQNRKKFDAKLCDKDLECNFCASLWTIVK